MMVPKDESGRKQEDKTVNFKMIMIVKKKNVVNNVSKIPSIELMMAQRFTP